jgi:prevent-host-death family protein
MSRRDLITFVGQVGNLPPIGNRPFCEPNTKGRFTIGGRNIILPYNDLVCCSYECGYKGCVMKSASVRELKNHASELLRQAAKEDVIITSRGRPVACLVGLQPGDVTVKAGVRRREHADDRHKREVLRLLAGIWRLKPEKGKQWISQEDHDAVLYGDPAE